MNHPILRRFALIIFASLSTTANAENHVVQPDEGGIKYGSDDCNNDAAFLTENGIVCSAIFSDTSVADFLDNLPRSITIAMFMELNPRLGPLEFDSVLTGISMLRVR